MSAAIWGAGSLNGLGFEQVWPVLLMLALIVPCLLVLARPMRQLELGDDAAMSSGIHANRLRLMLMICGVALTAIVTAAAGPIAENLSVVIPDGSFTVIVGPNACGKSTLLRALSRLLVPSAGQVILDGKAIAGYPAKQVARTVGLLPQTLIAPDGITVADLVSRGCYPHQSFFRQWSQEDEVAVASAMAATQTTEFSNRLVGELSGGQRQRVWVAMVLTQQTPILLLDEPTTFLDIAHQIELLDLCQDLNAAGRTIVAVLHDLNHACRYATNIIAMKDGTVIAEGPQPQS